MATLEGSVGAANQQLEKTSKLVKRIDDLGQRVTRGFEKWSGVLKSAKGVMGDIQSIWGTIQSVTAAVDNYTLLNMRLGAKRVRLMWPVRFEGRQRFL